MLFTIHVYIQNRILVQQYFVRMVTSVRLMVPVVMATVSHLVISTMAAVLLINSVC